MLGNKSINCFLVTMVLMFTSLSTFSEVVVIVHAENSVTSMSKTDIGRIFMGKTKTFSNGEKATAINQIAASSSRESFDSTYLGRSTKQMTAYWSKQLFSGQGKPPKELSGDLDVLQLVGNDKNAIGYIEREVVNGTVKVIDITD